MSQKGTRKLKATKEELEELYLNKGLGSERISKLFNCTHHTVLNRLRDFGIKIRKQNSNEYSGGRNPHWKGKDKLCKSYLTCMRHGAKIRNLEFNVTLDDLLDIYYKQNGKCALTNMELILPKNAKDFCGASIDRIDSSKGYTKENCQWVYKDINKMKNDLTQERFLELCKLVAINSGGI